MQQILFSLLLVLIPTQLGYHWWPGWALVLGRRIDYLSPTLYLTDILIFLLLISWVFVRRKVIISHKKIQRSTGIKIIFFFLFIFLNIFFAANRMVALFAWIKMLEMVGLGAYIVKTKPKFQRVIFFLSIGVLYSSLIAIIQFLLQHSIGGPFWFLGERAFSAATPGIAQISVCFPNRLNCPLMLRAYATFPHPNVLGGFLAITLPLAVVQLKDKKKNIFHNDCCFRAYCFGSNIQPQCVGCCNSQWHISGIQKKEARVFPHCSICNYISIFYRKNVRISG